MAKEPALGHLGAKLHNIVALRRATRLAVVVPLVLVLLSNIPVLAPSALFGVFGSLALLLFADFGGPLRYRFTAYLLTTAAGVPLILVGIVFGQSDLSGAVVMFVVALVIGLAALLRGPVASAQTVLLLVTVLSVTSAARGSQWTAAAAWVIGGVAAAVSAVVLWPARPSHRLSGPLAELYRTAAQVVRDRWVTRDEGTRSTDLGDMDSELSALHGQFDGNLMRPSGLTNNDRMIAQLVDLVGRVRAYQRWPTLEEERQDPAIADMDATLAEAVAEELDDIASDISGEGHDVCAERLQQARDQHLAQVTAWVQEARTTMPAADVRRQIDSSFPLRLTAISTELAAAGSNDSGTFDDPVLVGELDAVKGSAWTRIKRNLTWESPWFRNALRSAIALSISVALAKGIGLEHSFWIVLGTLTALRFDASGTGRTALQALVGTTTGVTIGAALILLVGDTTAVWWALLPLILLITGYTPGNFSLIVGQAGFSVTVIVLFSVLFPATLATAELRLIDVAIGLLVSLAVSAVMWPRGVAASLQSHMTDALTSASDYLLMSIDYIVGGAVDRRMLARFAERSSLALEQAREAYDLTIAQKPPGAVPIQTWFRAALVARHVDAAARQLPGAAERVAALDGGRTIPLSLTGPVLDTTHDVRDSLREVIHSFDDLRDRPAPEMSSHLLTAPQPDPLSERAVSELRHAIDEWLAQPPDWGGAGPDPRPAILAWITDWESFIAWSAAQLTATASGPPPTN